MSAVDSKHSPFGPTLRSPRLHMPEGEEILPLVKPRIEVRDLSDETTIVNEFVLTQLQSFSNGVGFSKPCPFDDLIENFAELNDSGWCSSISATGHQIAKFAVLAGGVAYTYFDKVGHEWLKTLSPEYAGGLAASILAISWFADRWFTKTDVSEAQNAREYQRLIGQVAQQYKRMGQIALVYFLIYEQDVPKDYRKSPAHERPSPDRNEMVPLADKIISHLPEIVSWLKKELNLKKKSDAEEMLYPLEAALKVIRHIAHNANLGNKADDVKMLDFYKGAKARFDRLLMREEALFKMQQLIVDHDKNRSLGLVTKKLSLKQEETIRHFQTLAEAQDKKMLTLQAALEKMRRDNAQAYDRLRSEMSAATADSIGDVRKSIEVLDKRTEEYLSLTTRTFMEQNSQFVAMLEKVPNLLSQGINPLHTIVRPQALRPWAFKGSSQGSDQAAVAAAAAAVGPNVLHSPSLPRPVAIHSPLSNASVQDPNVGARINGGSEKPTSSPSKPVTMPATPHAAVAAEVFPATPNFLHATPSPQQPEPAFPPFQSTLSAPSNLRRRTLADGFSPMAGTNGNALSMAATPKAVALKSGPPSTV